MKQLKDFNYDEIRIMFDNKIDTNIEIPESITKFQETLPDFDFSQPVEFAPTPTILTAEGMAQVFLHGGNDQDGKFTKLVVFVYALGGKIFYSKLNNNSYKAEITW